MKKFGPSPKIFRYGAERSRPPGTSSSTALWMDGLKAWMREAANFYGNSSAAPELSANRSATRDRTASSTLRFSPESVDGQEPSSPAHWIHAIRQPRWDSSARWAIYRTRRRKEACCMCLPFLRFAAALAIAASSFSCSHIGASKAPALTTQAVIAPRIERPDGVLRVCADPNNLPFSNQKQQ